MAEERLWAPWRLEYIKGPSPDECIFCTGPSAGDDREKHIVHRGEHCFVMLNAYPYNNGHVMVSPYRHVPSIEELDEPALLELMTLAQRSLGALRTAYAPEGFNLGINQGKVAGAGVEHHVHLHVVPRWGADTNFMPVIGDTRVLPQSLEDSYRDLTRAFESA
ncbi:MAG: adenylyltransferase [Thermoleophilaceae bacterium]|nr:adenylyltransferase [Thermoleophilaceae bacterium]